MTNWPPSFQYKRNNEILGTLCPRVTLLRRTEIDDDIATLTHVVEMAYVLRRVELHGRPSIEGQSPWSIRQTAVYSQYTRSGAISKETSRDRKSTFLLISPSGKAEKQLTSFSESELANERVSPSGKIHLLLVADSSSGWMEYMAWLEAQLKDLVSTTHFPVSSERYLSRKIGYRIFVLIIFMSQSNRIVFAEVGSKDQNLSPLTDFKISFADRQSLKLLEDSIFDLQTILSTLLRTIRCIRQQCQTYCNLECGKNEQSCDCAEVCYRFDEHIKEIEICSSRAYILEEKAKRTTQLASLSAPYIRKDTNTKLCSYQIC